MGRILSVDYGKKRTGIAVTDPLKLIANGLVTVPTSELFEFLNDYVYKESVERIVIGRPLQLNGEPVRTLLGLNSSITVGARHCPIFLLSTMMNVLPQLLHIRPL